MIRFVDRFQELGLLEADWKNAAPAFMVVFGRRRIGKTRLLEEFFKEKKGIKFTAEDVNKKVQITEFRRQLAPFLKDDFLSSQEFAEWNALFSYLSRTLPKRERFFVWIDEFSYIIKNDSAVTSVLQQFIDGFLRDSRVFFVVSGSLYGLLSEKVLSHSSPLYGRRTRDILLKPIPFPFVQALLKMPFEDTLKTYLAVNGIPEYLRVASKYGSFEDFAKKEFFSTNGYFYREPLFLLSQEFKEIKTYFSILNAIAYGNTRPTEIANFTGIKTREIYPYLELLIEYGFVKRETAMLGDHKKGVYWISDNFFDFWFNFVHKNREKIEKEIIPASPAELNRFLGKRFEIFIRENLLFFFPGFEESGKWWQKDQEIDLLAFNRQTAELLTGECKWHEKTNPYTVAAQLNQKTREVPWNQNKRKETMALFARSFSKKIRSFEGKKVHCFDLKDIERILKAKTRQTKTTGNPKNRHAY